MRRKGVSEGAETDYKREDQSLFINYVGAIFREGEVSIMTDEFEHECRLLYEMGLKDSTLRLEYEEKVRELSILREQMETEGKTKEQIALTMHERRRELGRLYKEAAPPLVPLNDIY